MYACKSLHVFHEHVDCDLPTLGCAINQLSLHVFHEHVDCDFHVRESLWRVRAFTCSMSTWIATGW